MERKANKKLIWVFLLVFIYAVYDAFNSASTGNDNTERGMVHYLLAAIVLSLVFFVFNKLVISINGQILALLFFTGYYAVNMYVLKGSFTWGSFVYLGLLVWWILTLIFISETINNSAESFLTIKKFAEFMFVFYFIIVVYGSINLENKYSVEFARVGYIYHVLAIFPILLLGKEEKKKKWFIIIAIFLTILSLKRGAIIIFPVMMFAYFYTEKKLGFSKNNFSRLFLAFIALAVVWIIIDVYTGGGLSSRFSSEELASGSGRADIWKQIFENLSKRNIAQLILGLKNGQEIPLSAGAHNEWLGSLYGYGVIGFVLFVGFIFSIIKIWKRLLKEKSIIAPAFSALIVFVLGVCTISGFVFVHSTFYVMIFIATTHGLSFLNEEELKKLLYRTKVREKK